ncbi:MAG: LytTR family transcriptional regulator DNA-binding domain-containing protein [Bacteroidetes bacterium]|nr:LytTR family transcriptional regulator DNA-binding domain-containing protein [Bacteroidota bacterium]
MKIQAIIIEDELPARTLVKNYLEGFEIIEIIGEYSDGFSGLKAINELKPDLVFLDIQMPKLTGFELLELTEHKPIIIFTTAFDQYAIKAFEANAVDYLLKPFSLQRFQGAVNKAIDRFDNNKTDETIVKSMIQTIDEKTEIINRIAIRTGSKIHLIATEEIVFIEADGDYVKIHTKDQSFLKEKTMKYFESHLDSTKFTRIHRSYLLNLEHIHRLEYYDKENYVAILKNDIHLKVSNSGYKLLKNHLKI